MQPFWSYSAQLVGPGYRFRTFRLSRLGGNVALPRIELWNVAKGWRRHPNRGAASVAGGELLMSLNNPIKLNLLNACAHQTRVARVTFAPGALATSTSTLKATVQMTRPPLRITRSG